MLGKQILKVSTVRELVLKQREEVDKEAHTATSVDSLICACDPRINWYYCERRSHGFKRRRFASEDSGADLRW